MLIISTCDSHSNLLENTIDTCSFNGDILFIFFLHIVIFYLQSSCVPCLHVHHTRSLLHLKTRLQLTIAHTRHTSSCTTYQFVLLHITSHLTLQIHWPLLHFFSLMPKRALVLHSFIHITLTLHNRLKLIHKIVTTYYNKTEHCRNRKQQKAIKTFLEHVTIKEVIYAKSGDKLFQFPVLRKEGRMTQ